MRRGSRLGDHLEDRRVQATSIPAMQRSGQSRSAGQWQSGPLCFNFVSSLVVVSGFVIVLAVTFMFAGQSNAATVSFDDEHVAEGRQPAENDADSVVANANTRSSIADSGDAVSGVQEVPRGQLLFEQDFREFDGFVSGSDGIGPMFNEVSCVACHNQGASGGGGGLMQNVDLLSVESGNPNQVIANVHSGFQSDAGFVPSLVLHRQSTDEFYDAERQKLLGSWAKVEDDKERLAEVFQRKPVRTIKAGRNISLLHTQRNTPALFGIGLLEQIPEELILEQAAREKPYGIRGRISMLPGENQIGRFGWRAQLPTVKEFVLSACSNEIGLNVEGHKQTKNPMETASTDATTVAAARMMGVFGFQGLDLNPTDTDAMIEYVNSINAPVIETPDYKFEAAVRGYHTFNEIGCAECHVRHMGPAENVFSDMLLHDMGKRLADPVAASREIETISTQREETGGTITFFEPPRAVNIYYVGTVIEIPRRTKPNYEDPYMDVEQRFAETDVDRRQEWRTPPLWGVADSAPYMHDGRAASLDDAIRMHSGESSKVTRMYKRLETGERDDLLTFLGCLHCPIEP